MQDIDAYWKWWYFTETGEEWDEPQEDHPSYTKYVKKYDSFNNDDENYEFDLTQKRSLFMPKKIILSDGEFAVLQKLLRQNPPAQVPNFDGADLYYYRELLTHVLKVNYRFPDTDDDLFTESLQSKERREV